MYFDEQLCSCTIILLACMQECLCQLLVLLCLFSDMINHEKRQENKERKPKHNAMAPTNKSIGKYGTTNQPNFAMFHAHFAAIPKPPTLL